jgi:hypothetical protein
MTRITHEPKRIPWLLTLLTLLLTTTQYAPPVHARDRHAGERSLTVDCQDRHISQRDAGWLLGIDNFGQTYAKRERLYAEIARVCAAGFTTVRIERKPAARSAAQVTQRR